MTRLSLRPFAGTFLLAFLCTQATGYAQPVPFSMEPERSDIEQPRERDQPPPADIPYLTEPGGADKRPAEDADAAVPPKAEPRVVAAPSAFRRFIVPDAQLQMRGEMAARSWSVVLTSEQAASDATLQIAYRNAILVAPEASLLRLSINGNPILSEHISSPDRRKQLQVEIPGGLLNAGRNLFSISVDQRHRTDCSVESTFDLWTDIDPAGTFLQFDNAGASRLRQISDIAAIGNNGEGQTLVHFVAPALEQMNSHELLLRLVQNIALIADMPRQSMSVMTSPPADNAAALTVYFGTAEQLSVFPAIRQQLGGSPVASFANLPGAGGSALIVSGGAWDDVARAVDSVASVATQIAAEIPDDLLRTQNAVVPDPPLITEAATFRLSDFGLGSREFSGRHFRTELSFGLPADFYAKAYGQLTIMLNAASAPSVLPGSSINIYVNDELAANVPITQRGGTIMNRLPIKVPLRHARPGLNTITIEGNFETREDQVCAPGQTANQDLRFVLFDTSELVFPRFARIGRIPDLSSFASFGFPYDTLPDETHLVLGDTRPGTFSAAATLLSRLAVAAGKPIALEADVSTSEMPEANAIFVGNIADIPQQALSQVGLADVARSSWADSTPTRKKTLGEVRDNEETLENWRKKLSEQGWRGRIYRLLQTLQNSFDLTQQNLSFSPGTGVAYAPPVGTSLLFAQNVSPDRGGAWTVVSAPNGQDMSSYLDVLVDRWPGLAGDVSALQTDSDEIFSQQSGAVEYTVTQPLSFGNTRLILTNWVSVNIIVFGGALLVVVTLLGLATAGLLRVFGRQS
ncbi:cellulose biosynthesis cyclic di-GMP-binding regulatory protein BcsB [Labrenzia sp. 011]|uniref:cellulose biosynthesis cyclic di-GMP-binding regulatory protein BcsB n=1 Tax=Labrenzia sp. 011 TaxID=2171494 RepID=UPI000D50F8BB|nr:cellulose biosynthesis cyclic di-GMP-binding regulatory protein BcsB [Labrenzia sp. 011]PVB60304.1 hypothetical protein DCO57_17795 [Labrenzia sp. 011]